MYSYSYDISEFLDNFIYMIEDFFESLDIGFIIGIIAVPLCIFLLFALAGYVLKSYAVYKLGKKFNRDNAALAWIPFYHDIFCMYVLSEITAKPYFSIHPKIDKALNIKSRKTAFYIYLGCVLIGPFFAAVLSGFMGIFISFIPFIGPATSAVVGSVIGLVLAVLSSVFRFVYLRDLLDALKRDKAENQQTALIISVIAYFVPIVFSIYLLTLLKYSPLAPYEYCDPYAAPGGNPYAAPNGNPYAAPGGNPYTAPNSNSYGANNNIPYGTQNNNPYGTQNNNPYAAPGSAAYGTPGNPPYGTPFGTPPSPPEAPSASPAPEAPTSPTAPESPQST